LNENVDLALDAICAKAMARRRYARYPSTTALADDVQRWMAGEPVTAYKERPSQRVGRWIQHHQRLSQLIAAAVIITIVAGITLTIAARHNTFVVQQARFEELRSDEREIEVQLVSAGRDLSKDVRFMSTLPPIQALIGARSGDAESEGEEVWRGRLETIYEGLLRANPNYLTVAYIAAKADAAEEVVRVERHATDHGYIRRVPKSRLATLQKSPLLDSVLQLGPGDVKISLDERLTTSHRKGEHRRLVTAVPVYDEQSGDIFGLVVIEADLTTRVQEILDGLEGRLGRVYVTDAVGNVLVTSNPEFGVEVAPPDARIADLAKEAIGLFAEKSRLRYLSDESTFIARRVQLDPADASCSLGIVQKLVAE
jgi:hypothetical protein